MLQLSWSGLVGLVGGPSRPSGPFQALWALPARHSPTVTAAFDRSRESSFLFTTSDIGSPGLLGEDRGGSDGELLSPVSQVSEVKSSDKCCIFAQCALCIVYLSYNDKDNDSTSIRSDE